MDSDAFSSRLSEGEQILWSGRPGIGLMRARADVFITSMLLWMGFSEFPDSVALSSEASLLLWLPNVFNIAYGLILIAIPFFLYVHAFQKSFYAVTSSRILLLWRGTHNSLVALPIDRSLVFSLTKGRKGRGTILFGPDLRLHPDKPLFFPKSSFRIYFDPRYKFFAIDDAQEVFSLIQSAVAAA